MSEAEKGVPQPDPMEKMRELRDAYLEIWSKQLIETVNSESYAQASGAALNSYLSVAAPFKEPAEQALLRTLQELHIPSSADFTSLAGRITNIEMQLDNMDAKLDRMEKLLAGMQTDRSAGAGMPAESTRQGSRGPAGVRGRGATRAAASRAGRRPVKRKK